MTLAHLLVAALAMSLLTFAAYGWDKRLAAKGRWRISEFRLLLLAFLLGFAGAWTGMKVFRHKLRKTGFKVRLALLTVVNPMWPLLWICVR